MLADQSFGGGGRVTPMRGLWRWRGSAFFDKQDKLFFGLKSANNIHSY
jgi:hypothetical protein